MIYDTIVTRESITKGWSGDQKFCVTTEDGSKYLLRITVPGREERFRTVFTRMQKLERYSIPMCRPVELGECHEGTYAIQSWIEGRDAEEVIPMLSPEKQYVYGIDTGRILAQIHSIPAPEGIPDWQTHFNRKIDRKIRMYESCPLKYENGDCFLTFIAENRDLLAGRPQCYQHGDYHIGNMMVDSRGILTIIDFDKDDYGDPWEEFNRIVWCAQTSPMFASGMVDGYFDGKVPADFWHLLALYICSNTLGSLPWAIPFGDKEINVMRKQAEEVLGWYDNMKNVVPKWYTRG